MFPKRFKEFTFQTAEKLGLIDLVQKAGRIRGKQLYVLTYHRVDEPGNRPWLDPHNISALPEQFNEQMKLLAEKYNPVGVRDVFACMRGKRSLPDDAVLVTVDDGYRDFKEVIFPTCVKYGIEPLLFVPTAFVGTGGFWWDKVHQIMLWSGKDEIDTPAGRLEIKQANEREHASHYLIQYLKRMPFEQAMTWVDETYATLIDPRPEWKNDTLTWDELRQLKKMGAVIAPHTHSHPILSQVSEAEVKAQVEISRELILNELGEVEPIFAIPDGKQIAYSPEIIQVIQNAGFDIVFLMEDGRAMIEPGMEKTVFPRIGVWRSLSLAKFHYRLTPAAQRINNWL